MVKIRNFLKTKKKIITNHEVNVNKMLKHQYFQKINSTVLTVFLKIIK